LGLKARNIVKKAEHNKVMIAVSVIVLLEALVIQEKKRIDFEIDKLFAFIENSPGFRIADLDLNDIKAIILAGQDLNLHDNFYFRQNVQRAYFN